MDRHPVTETDQDLTGRAVLVQRMTDRHGLSQAAALDAVVRAEQHLGGPHTDTVRAEARAVLAEAVVSMHQQITEAFEGLAAAVRTAAEGLWTALTATREQFALAPPPPASGRRPDRPPWQSPYGPPTRRH